MLKELREHNPRHSIELLFDEHGSTSHYTNLKESPSTMLNYHITDLNRVSPLAIIEPDSESEFQCYK